MALLGGLLTAGLGACAPDGSAAGNASAESPPGRLVIIGGGLDGENAPVFDAVLAARDGGGPVCVVPTAGADPEGAIASMVETLDAYGGAGTAVGIPISTAAPELARDTAVAARIRACSGFYFTGGSQRRVVEVFLPDGDTTVAYRALRKRWEEGAVLAGSSAGAAMMSRVMIAGGGSETAIRHGVALRDEDEGVRIMGGMGFFPPALLDQHFLARGRIGRSLVAALAVDSVPVSLGIDENTALVVEGDSARVLGVSGVVVVDARAARRDGAHRGTGVRVWLAGAGDVIDLAGFSVRRGDGKVPVPSVGGDGSAGGQDPAVEDPLARWAFLQVMAGLAAGPSTHATFTLDGVTLSVWEGDGFSAWMRAPDGGIQGAPAGFGAGPFLVDLVER